VFVFNKKYVVKLTFLLLLSVEPCSSSNVPCQDVLALFFANIYRVLVSAAVNLVPVVWRRLATAVVFCRGLLYVQKRSTLKDYCPGYYDACAGGGGAVPRILQKCEYSQEQLRIKKWQ